jgi:hypothetical protein
MHHCLSKDELKQFLDLKVNNVAITTEDLRLWIDLADNWQDELGALTYFLSHILERRVKDGLDCVGLIRIFYALPEVTWLHIQEFDSKFIDYMLRNLRDKRRNLEEELMDLQNRFREYNYERTLHY